MKKSNELMNKIEMYSKFRSIAKAGSRKDALEFSIDLMNEKILLESMLLESLGIEEDEEIKIDDIDASEGSICKLLGQGKPEIRTPKKEKKRVETKKNPKLSDELKKALKLKNPLFSRYEEVEYLSDMTLSEIYNAKEDRTAQTKFKWMLKCNSAKYRRAAELVKNYYENMA